MSTSPFPADLAGDVWNNLFDFLEPPNLYRPSTSRGERDADGRLKKGAPTRRERAHARYEEIFCKLTAYFDNRSCGDAEDRAVETILRVAMKCRTVTLEEGTEPVSYFFGCAHNILHEVHKEWKRESKLQREQQIKPATESTEVKETRDRCLEECMKAKLGDDERTLILDYYRGERSAKIEHRRKLATARDKDLNALRIETHRIRKKLRSCVSNCLERRAEGVVST